MRVTSLSLVLSALVSPTAGYGLDFKTPCDIHNVTSGAFDHTHAYPTARTWSDDSKWLFVESPGPDADGKVLKNARHLIAVNIETNNRRYLATTVHPDPDQPPAWMGFDYAPEANALVYFGPKSRRIYMVDVQTGEQGLLLEEPEAILQGPLTVAWDGTRVVYWTMFPAKHSRFFDDYITTIFYFDVDPTTLKRTSEPKIIEAYPRRKGPGWSPTSIKDAVHINHPQINPKNKNHITYAHEMLGSRPDGTIARSRLWHSFVDESRKQPLIHQPAGLDFTHEVIAPDGKSLIFPYMLGVGQVFFDTREARSIFYNPSSCPGHLTISPDMKWLAGDTWGQWKDEAGQTWQSVMLIEVATRKWAHVAWFYHSHPHPIFSPDGSKIAFSHRDKLGYQQVAWIDISQIKRNWDDVHDGVGDIASPAWIEGVDNAAK